MVAQAQTIPWISPEEYLAIERQADYKGEYFDGEIFAMAGAGPKHVLIVTNVVSELRMQLKRTIPALYTLPIYASKSAD